MYVELKAGFLYLYCWEPVYGFGNHGLISYGVCIFIPKYDENLIKINVVNSVCVDGLI